MNDEESRKGYGHVLKYTGIFGGVQGLNILIGLVRNKLVAVILGPAGMGLASLFNTTVNFISQATNLGLPVSAVKHLSEVADSGDSGLINHQIRIIRAWALLTAVIGMLVCIVAGPILSSSAFSWGDHTLHFVLLAPAVGLLAITGGETAILKATRRLRQLAVIQVSAVLASLLISVPIYSLFGQPGIVPVIVLMALTTMLLTIFYSFRYYPLQMRCSRGLLGEGMQMVRLGLAFVFGGIITSGSEILTRSFLNVYGTLDEVGLYNAGYMLIITLAGIAASAMEADYFPRLSAVNADRQAVNTIVNQQIEVSLLLLSPMLVLFIVGLPILLPLLYSSRFMPVVAMTQVAAFSIYLKVITTPMEYITLAKGHSVAFVVLDGVFVISQVALIMLCYHSWGLFGAGVALSLSYVAELIVMLLYAGLRYRYFLSSRVCLYVLVQLPLGISAYVLTLCAYGWLYWLLGTAIFLFSAAFSLYILYQKTSLWNKLKQRFLHR